MAEIKIVNERMLVDTMARDYDSLLLSMRALIPAKLPEWTEYTSEADFGNVLLQLFAHMGDLLSYYQDRVANESFLGTAQTRRSIIHHLRLIGYRLSTAAPAAARLTLTVPVTINGVVTITRGDAFATKSRKNQKSVRFEYTGETPLKINFGDPAVFTLDPTHQKKIYGTGIPVEEGRLVKDEILGVSAGTPDQRFTLAHAGVILRALGSAQQDLVLRTEQGDTIETWTLRESLAFSRENQRDFVAEVDEQDRATVRFGDGAFGSIPPAGRTIKVTYRVGGGTHGNVAAGTIQTIAAAPQLALLNAKVANSDPATGGAERESIEHAVTHAPRVFRSLKRAVTADDYEALALDFNGVGKVRAVSTYWNTVTLFVAPKGGGQVSDVLEADLLAYFEDKRPLSTILEIADVDYVKIYVTAEVGIKSFYSRDEIEGRVKEAAGALLAFDNVDFGKTIYLSKFYEAIEALEGVEFVNITEFGRDAAYADPTLNVVKPGDAVERRGKIELSPGEIPKAPDGPADADYAGGIKVRLLGGG